MQRNNGRDGLAHSRSLSTARRALRVAQAGLRLTPVYMYIRRPRRAMNRTSRVWHLTPENEKREHYDINQARTYRHILYVYMYMKPRVHPENDMQRNNGRDGLAHSRSLSTARRALRVAQIGVASCINQFIKTKEKTNEMITLYAQLR